MNCGRCGDTADGLNPIVVSGQPLQLCNICGDLLWGWLGFEPLPGAEEKPIVPEPPVSIYYED